MKGKIKQLLREGLDDSYSNYHGRKEVFFNSLKTIEDLQVSMIPQIINFLGCQGFNSDEDAQEYLEDRIKEYNSFSNPVTLYRIVGVLNKKMIDTNEIGQHFTPYEWALDDDMLSSIGAENWADNCKPYILVVSVPLSEIDIMQTLVQNLSFPNEQEINLKNNGKGVKLVKIKKYK